MKNGAHKHKVNESKIESCEHEVEVSEQIGVAAMNHAIVKKDFNIKHAVVGVLVSAMKALYFFSPSIEEADLIVKKTRAVAMANLRVLKIATKKKGAVKK